MTSRKNVLFKKALLTAGDASQSTLTSSVLPVDGLDNLSIQANVNSGSPSGTLAVQVSVDYQQDTQGNAIPGNTANWVTLTSQAISAGNPSPVLFNLTLVPTLFLRVVYTRASGSGSISIFAVGKQV